MLVEELTGISHYTGLAGVYLSMLSHSVEELSIRASETVASWISLQRSPCTPGGCCSHPAVEWVFLPAQGIALSSLWSAGFQHGWPCSVTSNPGELIFHLVIPGLEHCQLISDGPAARAPLGCTLYSNVSLQPYTTQGSVTKPAQRARFQCLQMQVWVWMGLCQCLSACTCKHRCLGCQSCTLAHCTNHTAFLWRENPLWKFRLPFALSLCWTVIDHISWSWFKLCFPSLFHPLDLPSSPY